MTTRSSSASIFRLDRIRTALIAYTWITGFALLFACARPADAAPPSPSQVGQWSSVYTWPDVAIHLHLLPDGHVLTFADDDNPNYPINGARLAGSTKTYVVDIPNGGAPGTVVSLPNTHTDMFCSGHVYLRDGRLFVLGGHLGRDGWGDPNTDIFDFNNPYNWTSGDDMWEGRWYPSGCQLANGEFLAISGTLDSLGTSSSIPEVWSPTSPTGWRQLTNANRVLPYYPYTFLAPNGKVFCAGPGIDTRYLDCTGLGSWQFVANHISNFERSYAAPVQYGDGKYIVIGGGDPPTSTCETIDLNQANPTWQSTAAMQNSRRHHNGTMLPDGTILVTGGTSGAGFNTYTGYVLPAELWDPASPGTWKKLASMTRPRVYHSTAALLPDGRVLIAGSGRPKAQNGGVDEWNAEIFSPPYLFQGTRPTITSASSSAILGSTISITTPNAASITKVTLIGLTTTTHAFNMGQHFSQLPFTAGSGVVQATLPATTVLLPPGYYMLFVLTGGIPSVAKMIQVQPVPTVGVPEEPTASLLDFMALRSPNPMTSGQARIVFTLSHSEVGRLDVLDVTGRLVKNVADGYFVAGVEQSVRWDGRNAEGARVPSGVYWYRLQTPSVTLTGKVALLSH